MVTKKQCAFDGCDRPAVAKGLCQPHYHQQMRGVELKPLRAYNKGLHKDENGRVCSKCSLYKTWTNFYNETRSQCKPCTIKQNTLINRRVKASDNA